jgi:ABC-type proline/glycine betaine transport system permease subunit
VLMSEPNSSRRAQIQEMVGEAAANDVYGQAYWPRAGAFLTLMCVIGLIFIQYHPKWHDLYSAIWLLFAGVILCGFQGARLGRRAGKAASKFVSARLGRPVVMTSGGTQVRAWERIISKATHDR